MEKRILIFGRGQVAHFYENFYQNKNVELTISSADITKLDEVRVAVEEFKPNVVINTAAKTNLEWCGNNRLDAFNVNVLGAGNIAKVCDEANVYLIHFSSGCIFSSVDGTDIKTEESLPNPSSYYGWTKVWSEEIVMFERSDNFKCLILRPRQPISAQLNHKNMLTKMLTFSKFVDTPNSGTVIEDLMIWTDQLIDKQVTGVLHVANSGWTTPYNIGLMIKEYILPDLEPEKIEKAELDKMTPNTRVDTVLGIDRLEGLGISVTPYDQRLREIIKELGENIKKTDKAEVKEQLETTAAASRQRTVLNEVFPSLYQ